MACCTQTCGLIALGVVSLAYLAYRFVHRMLNPQPVYPRPTSSHVLITGASSGIGADAALSLALAGYTVHAGVRKTADGDSLVKAFEGERSARDGGGKCSATLLKKGKLDQNGGSIQPVIIDVAKDDSVKKGIAEVEKRCGGDGLGALVNNAGVLVVGPMEFLPLDKVRQQLDVNVVGQVAVTQAALPLLRKSGRGARIVFVSSMAGRATMPFNGAYAASKHAVEAVADAYRLELAPWGISVSVLEPGFVESKILASSDTQSAIPASKLPGGWGHYYGSYFESPPRRSSKNVAPVSVTSKAIHECISSATPKTRYVLGVKSLVKMFRISSWLPDRYVDQTLAKKAWPGRYRAKIPKD